MDHISMLEEVVGPSSRKTRILRMPEFRSVLADCLPQVMTRAIFDIYNAQYSQPRNWVPLPGQRGVRSAFQISMNTSAGHTDDDCKDKDKDQSKHKEPDLVMYSVQTYPARIPLLIGESGDFLLQDHKTRISDEMTVEHIAELVRTRGPPEYLTLFLAPGTEEHRRFVAWFEKTWQHLPKTGLYRMGRPWLHDGRLQFDFQVPSVDNARWLHDMRRPGWRGRRIHDCDMLRDAWRIYEQPERFGFGVLPGLIEFHRRHSPSLEALEVADLSHYFSSEGAETKASNGDKIGAGHAKTTSKLTTAVPLPLTLPLAPRLEEHSTIARYQDMCWDAQDSETAQPVWVAQPLDMSRVSMAQAIQSGWAKDTLDYLQKVRLQTEIATDLAVLPRLRNRNPILDLHQYGCM